MGSSSLTRNRNCDPLIGIKVLATGPLGKSLLLLHDATFSPTSLSILMMGLVYFFLLFPTLFLLLLGPRILFLLVSFFHIWHFALRSGDPWFSLTFKSKTVHDSTLHVPEWGFFCGEVHKLTSKSPLWSDLNSPPERESPGAGAGRNR